MQISEMEAELLHSVEFTKKRRIFTVISYSRHNSYNEFHVEYDKEGQGWWHWAGGGPVHDLVYQRGEGLAQASVDTLRDLIEKYDLYCGEVVWCNICKCSYPEDDQYEIDEITFNGTVYRDTYALCPHIFWDNIEGIWYGPGSEEYFCEKEVKQWDSPK